MNQKYKGKSRKELVAIWRNLQSKLSATKRSIFRVEEALRSLKNVSRTCKSCRNFIPKGRNGQGHSTKMYCMVNNKFYSPKHSCGQWVPKQ
jgi:predicted RNA-binding protein with EMAP domain